MQSLIMRNLFLFQKFILIEMGVLKKTNNFQSAAPTFIIPKINGTVRFMSDFRELQERIQRQPLSIPKHSKFIT